MVQSDGLRVREFTVKFRPNGTGTINASVEVKGCDDQITVDYDLPDIGADEQTIQHITQEIRIRADEQWKMIQRKKKANQANKFVEQTEGFTEI